MDYRFRISLLKNEHKVFGEGPMLLLKNVEETGSLRQAALAMDMSYSKAWSIIKSIEKELATPMLDRSICGKQGGGSKLTQSARRLIAGYEQP